MFSFRNRDKINHYKQAIKNFNKMKWNLEFDIESLRTIREGFRIEYDKSKEGIVALTERIKNLEARNAEGDAQEIDLVKTKIQGMEKDCAQLEEQMQGIDNEIDGMNYTDDTGTQRRHEGIIEKIDKINTRIEMLKEHINKL